MDFHGLSRRDLRMLSKKNRIPANNMINVAKADDLRAVQTVEGVGATKETQPFQSPVKAELWSPNLPRTCWGTVAR
ncbi:putative daf-12-interacting protein 1 [Cocos nucifera]|uniref:Putative daf-12-interacting protein 1 n=1 Tax=Cocos nucifera TaxID=13894 RepID=A0A8K0IM62_COCNU|nr:putative daf-12-interacting protein 1 [Cocos nucifera]